jgi:hypothetical protein
MRTPAESTTKMRNASSEVRKMKQMIDKSTRSCAAGSPAPDLVDRARRRAMPAKSPRQRGHLRSEAQIQTT